MRIAFEPLPGAYPPTINTVAEAAHCVEAAAAVAGRENVRTGEPPSMGAEDFAFYLRHKPGAYVWIGNGVAGVADPALAGCERRIGAALHNPVYDFNDDILPIGAAYWVELVRRLLPRER